MSGLPPQLQGLLAAAAYPHAVQSVKLIETHISWILLTGEWAYKLKRPVHYPFVDLRSAQHRAYLCREEVRLNQRFAPQLYIGVCPVTLAEGEIRMGGCGQVIEHAVKMLQFAPEEVLDRLVDAAPVPSEILAEFAHNLARIHASLPAATSAHDWGRPAVVRAQMLENLEQCATAAAIFDDPDGANALQPALIAALENAQGCMAERRQNGQVRECHGDLHCGNIVRRGAQLLPFDCLEFDPALRWMDVAQEVATLLGDLNSRGQPTLAAAFLGGYLLQAGDHQACRLLNLYQAHRCLVRAKVMALNAQNAAREHADTDDSRGQYQRYVACANTALSPHRPCLILLHGLSGSGKSWLAQHLAPHLAAVHLSSDVERRRLPGRYSPEARAHVYEHLATCATHTLAGGYTTIVDATFGSRNQRARFQALAADLAVPLCLVRCNAPPELLRARIDARLQARNDWSEATRDVLAWQQGHPEPVTADEGFRVFEVNTADPDSVAQLRQSLAGFLGR